MKAVRFNEYGGRDVLQIVDVAQPVPGPGQALVKVKAAGINPGEANIRTGLLATRFPTTFPSGQGSDFAGIVAEIGPDVSSVRVGDEVIGFSNQRSSHATYVAVPAVQLTAKPANVPGNRPEHSSSPVPRPMPRSGRSDSIQGIGSSSPCGRRRRAITAQLAVHRGAQEVIGLAGPSHHSGLRHME